MATGINYMAFPPASRELHSVIFSVLAVVCLVVALVPLWTRMEIGRQRKFYWLGTFAAAASAFFAVLPNWQAGLALAAAGVAFMVFPAYFTSSLIKVRGRVFAYHIRDAEPDREPRRVATPDDDPWPDAYGNGVTAAKAWWVMIGIVVICVGNVVFSVLADKVEWTTLAAAVAFVIFALGFGYGDASWGYRVARGQHIQFAIIGILTVGTFTVLYLTAFVAGWRWPLRRKESLEYRAHPRHQRKQQ
ncbi:hypothetical protein OG976_16610 [Mycobacterium sp. NBC_00419]|uniref:hypothetical protein n=1 Tax=Mycobacterium sp. NBC_00419 TaxID=2975989 RepID=UPI002E1D25A0